MKNSLLSASILSADFSNLKDSILQCEDADCDWIHIDVMDGHFVPNITMGPFIVETCKRITRLPLDVHLMIEKPELHIESFIKSGASNVTIHIENNPNVHRTLQQIRNLGANPGIALNPGTPASAIASVIPFIDMVLVMTVNPGYSGQSFMPEMVAKIKEVAEMARSAQKPLRIEVDGGITPETLVPCQAAGANTFVAATAVFKHPAGISSGIAALRSVMN
jgi:ribulose-phosphate 3-epimerase